MGIAIPQVITDRSGAQKIDGSLRFDDDFQNSLSRSVSTAGNRRTWTFSCWLKKSKLYADSTYQNLFSSLNTGTIQFDTIDQLRIYDNAGGATREANSVRMRDTIGWYHIVVKFDTTQSTDTDRVFIYLNGEDISKKTGSWPSQNYHSPFNAAQTHYLGTSSDSNNYLPGLLSQVYLIDGQALGPEYFGFTDPLTNTWKPKKYTGSFTSTRSEGATLNTSFATSPPTDSTGTTTLTTQNISTQTASTNDFGVTTSTLFSGASQYSRVTTNLTIDISQPFTIDFIAKFNQTGSSSYFCQYGSGSAIIQTDNPAANTTCLLWGAHTFSMSYGWHSVRVQWDGSRSKLWVDGTLTLNITNSPGGSDGALAIGAHPTQDIRTFNGEFGPFRFTPAALGAPKSGGLDASDFADSTTLDNPNSFYLPMDGNSPIGKDQSGNGNDWTPVNFGGIVTPDSPIVSGARPILNTTQGGAVAGVGVFGSDQNVGYAVTVYNDGGGNKYYIDGVKQDTITGLIRGATYTFDTSDSTVSSHPFRLSATSNGSHGGGSEYVDGVAAITGAATTITVPHNAPNTLYYYCTSHSGMGADITGITTNEKLADPYAWKCILALPGKGERVAGYVDISPSIACTSVRKVPDAGGSDPVGISTGSNLYGGSLQLDGNDYISYTRTNDGDFSGQNDYTIEMWFYTEKHTTDCGLISNWPSGNNRSILFGPNASNGAKLRFIFNTTGSGGWTDLATDQTSILKKWYHVAWVYDHSATRHYAYIDGVLVGSATGTVYNNTTAPFVIGKNKIDGSGFFNGKVQDIRYYHAVKYTASGTTAGEVVFTPPSRSPAILPDSPSGVSGGSKLTKITNGAVVFDGTGDYLSLANDDTNLQLDGDFTVELYVYAPNINSSSGTQYLIEYARDGNNGWGIAISNDRLYGFFGSGSNAFDTSIYNELTPTGWNHIAWTREGNQHYVYINGIRLTGNSVSGTQPSSSGSNVMNIGRFMNNTSYFKGFISNVRVIKGTAIYTGPRIRSRITAPLTNVTNTKLLCCQSNTSATEAAVTPGTITANGDATATNFNPFITDINTVRGQETSYCTLNPLDSGSGVTLTYGNLTFSSSGSSQAVRETQGTMPMPTTGKYYFEVLVIAVGEVNIGLRNAVNGNLSVYYRYSTGGFNNIYIDGSNDNSVASYTNGDVIGVAYNSDDQKISWYKNGIAVASPFSLTNNGELFPHASHGSVNGTASGVFNFGQKPFKFPPPDGFQPLNTANTRPVKVISRSDQYVGVATYRGTGANQQIDVISKPDLVIIKGRDGDYDFVWQDTVRGLNKTLTSNRNNDEKTDNDGVLSVNTDGFVVGANTAGFQSDELNKSGKNYVTYCFKAGGNKNTFNVDGVGYASAAAAGITEGTLSLSGASIGTKQGFSICKYTSPASYDGSTWGHGLSQAPDFIISRMLNSGGDWSVYHSSTPTKYFLLNSNAAQAGSNNWTVTSTTVTMGAGLWTANSQPSIAYHWHNVPGLQKFGSYSGNNNADGPFVELGFRPAVLWVKRVGSTGSWYALDIERDKFNNTFRTLSPNQYAQEDSTTGASGYCDFLSNGFKARIAEGSINASDTYIYMAWATAPSIDLYGGGANAR